MASRLAQLIALMEEGDENALADIQKEFPSFFKKIQKQSREKEKPRKMAMGGKVSKPQGVRKATKGFGRAYKT
jgi:hypothetical protein